MKSNSNEKESLRKLTVCSMEYAKSRRLSDGDVLSSGRGAPTGALFGLTRLAIEDEYTDSNGFYPPRRKSSEAERPNLDNVMTQIVMPIDEKEGGQEIREKAGRPSVSAAVKGSIGGSGEAVENSKGGEEGEVFGENNIHVVEDSQKANRRLVSEPNASNPTTQGVDLFHQINLFAETIRTPHDELVDAVGNDGVGNTMVPIITMRQQCETMRDVAPSGVTDVATYVDPYAAGGTQPVFPE